MKAARSSGAPSVTVIEGLSLPSAGSQLLKSPTRNQLHQGTQAIDQQQHEFAVEVEGGLQAGSEGL